MRIRALLFVAGALFAGLAVRNGIAPHDEGLMLAAARRVADGQLPYRDFWFNYGPAQPYVLAALQALTGPSLLAWRIWTVLVEAAAALLVFEAVAPRSRRWALAGWAAAIATLAWPSLPGPNAPGLALALAAVVLAGSRPRAAAAVAGAAALMRPELGLAAVVAVGLLSGVRTLWPAAAVAVGGWLPFLLASPSGVYDGTVGFLRIQHLQRTPLPLSYDGGADPNKLLEFYLPLVLVLGCAAYLAWALWRRPGRVALAPLPLVVVGLLYLLGRPDEFHLILAGTALALALSTAATHDATVRVAAGVLLGLIVLHGVDRQAGRVRHPGPQAAVPGPAGDGVRTAPAEARALAQLRRRLPPGPVLVVPPRLDRVSVGDPLLYTILDRDNPSRYDVIQPGLVTTDEVQRELIADLRRTRATVIVWTDPRATRVEDDGAGRERGSRRFTRYLLQRYRYGFRAGPFLVEVPR